MGYTWGILWMDGWIRTMVHSLYKPLIGTVEIEVVVSQQKEHLLDDCFVRSLIFQPVEICLVTKVL